MTLTSSYIFSLTRRRIIPPRTSPKNFPVSLSSSDTIIKPWLSRMKQSVSFITPFWKHALSHESPHFDYKRIERKTNYIWKDKILKILTLLVVFLKKVKSADCLNWYPTTATGADFLSTVWKIACVAVTIGSLKSPSPKICDTWTINILNKRKVAITDHHYMEQRIQNSAVQCSIVQRPVYTTLRQWHECYQMSPYVQ